MEKSSHLFPFASIVYMRCMIGEGVVIGWLRRRRIVRGLWSLGKAESDASNSRERSPGNCHHLLFPSSSHSQHRRSASPSCTHRYQRLTRSTQLFDTTTPRNSPFALLFPPPPSWSHLDRHLFQLSVSPRLSHKKISLLIGRALQQNEDP